MPALSTSKEAVNSLSSSTAQSKADSGFRDAVFSSSEVVAPTTRCTAAASPSGSVAHSISDVTNTKDAGEDDIIVKESDAAQSGFKALHLQRDWYSTAATFVAGGVAGAASRTLTAPLDRVKVIVQEGHLVRGPDGSTVKKKGNPNLLEVARAIKADGGWKGFWRGNMVNCFKAGPEFAIVFTLRRYLTSWYDDCVEAENQRIRNAAANYDKLAEENDALVRRERMNQAAMLSPKGSEMIENEITEERALRCTPEDRARRQTERQRAIDREGAALHLPFDTNIRFSKIPRLMVNCTIGAAAGVGSQSVLYPMEVVKTRVCVSRNSEFTGGVRQIVMQAYQSGGIREFYRGFTPNMVGIIVYRGLEMGLYSSVQQSIMLYRMRWHELSKHDSALSAAEVGIVGMFASMIAQTVSYPLNVVRTRLQTQGTNGRERKYTGMVDCFVKILRDKGVRALFSGLTANYLKAVPASACTFMVFEKTQQLLLGDD